MLKDVLGQSNRSESGQEEAAQSGAEEDIFQERPRVCLLDVNETAVQELAEAGFNCTSGSLGPIARLPIKQGEYRFCKLAYTIPENLHEYDILVVDTQASEPVKDEGVIWRLEGGTRMAIALVRCAFPQTVFNSRPLAGHVIADDVGRIRGRESVVVVFAGRRKPVKYQAVEVLEQTWTLEDTLEFDSLSFLRGLPSSEDRSGEHTIVSEKLPDAFRRFLDRYNREFSYHVVFQHPTKYVNHERVKDHDFAPLILNSVGEIVSYVHFEGSSCLFVFPQLEDKTHFLLELFQEHLPAMVPSLFPFSTQFAWLQDDEYRVPNEAELRAEKEALEHEYAEKIVAKEQEIEANYAEYEFLHDLLTETGSELVDAVEQYLDWLGFEDVTDCDEAYPGRNEEDLQVQLDQGLLVVEVKGIRGTSTDSDCSQVGKYGHRRAEERDAFDVSALYIVNHQRHLPPTERQNPPFTEEQIKDAVADKRGLLTTYSLFKLYFAVEAGCISKDDARRSLLDYGLVEFSPSDSDLIGRPLKTHHSGTVGVFELSGVCVQVGDRLLVYENGQCRQAEVVSLRDAEDNDVTEVCEGTAGIKLSLAISEDSKVLKPT
jgi:hypothetical protein